MLKSLLKAVPTGLGYLTSHVAAYHSKQYEIKNGRNLWNPVIASILILIGASILIPNQDFRTGVAMKVLVTIIDASIPRKNDIRHYIGLSPKYMSYNGITV